MRNTSFALLLATAAFNGLLAQPFLDLVKADHLEAPGFLSRTEFNLSLPIKLDTTGRLLLLDPLVVQWNTTTGPGQYSPEPASDVQERMGAFVLPVGYITPIGTKGWRLTTVPIVRYAWLENTESGMVQVAGLVLFSRRVRPDLTWRYGVYVSNEAFGLFVRPLLGIDWRISPRANLFGVLPGTLNYEYKLTSRVHTGASFRAYTNSYGTPDGAYRRVDENPLGVFADLYLTRRIVLRGEAGRSFVCQLRGGALDPAWAGPGEKQNGYVDHAMRDHFYFRVLLAFRMRLDDKP